MDRTNYFEEKLNELYEDLSHLEEFILDPYQDCSFGDFKALQFIMRQIKNYRKILLNNEEKNENGK